MKLLTQLGLFNGVADRFAISEYPYSKTMDRKFQLSLKEWHNLILLTLIQNPFIILCTHKPLSAEYPKSQYLPYDKWDECLSLYREFLNTHLIPYTEYDYATATISPHIITAMAGVHADRMRWWTPMWKAGYGAIGSVNPKVLLVAERIGPNNMNNIPFETGPTGYMLTDMLVETGTPLGKFAVTNMVKSFRRDSRPPNKEDQELLRIELEHFKPEKVVFMGAVAKYGIKVAKDLGIDHSEITHFGYYSHRGITDLSDIYAEWRKVIGLIPSLTFRRGNEERTG